MKEHFLPHVPSLCHPWARSACFAKQNLELLDPRIFSMEAGSSGQEKVRFSSGNPTFSSPRMTRGSD